VLPDAVLSKELNKGMGACLSHSFTYRYSLSEANAIEQANFEVAQGNVLDLVVVDSTDTCSRLRASDPGVFDNAAFAVLDSRKDDFYTHYDSFRKRNQYAEETDAAVNYTWDSVGFLACVLANLSHPESLLPTYTDEASPLAGISKEILEGLDPATLQRAVPEDRAVDNINRISSALTDIGFRRMRRREEAVPFELVVL
jgi:hypothetical protein